MVIMRIRNNIKPCTISSKNTLKTILKYSDKRKNTIFWTNMDLKSALTWKFQEVISRIYTPGNILLLFSISSIIRESNLKLKVRKKEKLTCQNFVTIANLQKVVPLDTKSVQHVRWYTTAVQTAKEQIGKLDTINSAKNFKRRIRNDHWKD